MQLLSRSATTSNWEVVGSATYAEKGTYTAAVTVSDVDGNGLQSSQTTFNVADASLTDTSSSVTVNAVEGNIHHHAIDARGQGAACVEREIAAVLIPKEPGGLVGAVIVRRVDLR